MFFVNLFSITLVMLKLMAARSPKVNRKEVNKICVELQHDSKSATSGAKAGVSRNMVETIATRNGVENVRDLYAGTS